MPQEPLPEPEGEQLATLLGESSTRLAYGLLYRRRTNPPTAAEVGLCLDAAASGGTSTDRILRSLKAHFDIATEEKRRKANRKKVAAASDGTQ